MFNRSKLGSLLLPAALAAGTLLSLPTFAAPASTDADAPAAHWGYHGPRHLPEFARALHQVQLSDAQKSQIREMFKADHEAMRTQFQSLREQRLAFDRAVPGSSEFQTAETTLLQSVGAAAQAHVQHEAELHTKVYSLLTDEQKGQLAQALAKLPKQAEAEDAAGAAGFGAP